MLAKARNLHKLGVADAQSHLPEVSTLLLEPMKEVQLDQKVLDAIAEENHPEIDMLDDIDER